MLNKKLFLALSAVSAMAFSTTALASDGTITFEGIVNSKTCTLDTTTINKTVALPSVQSSAFSGAGTYAGSQAFSLTATGCDAGAVAAAVFATGGQVDAATGNLDNAFPGGTDAQVAVFQADGTTKIDLSNYGSSSTYTATADGSGNVKLDFVAKYAAKNATVTPGILKTSVQYDMFYQ